MNKAMLNIIIMVAIILGINFFSQVQASDFKIIVNKNNPVSTLSKTKVSQFFLKKDTEWDHGLKVLPVDQLESSYIRKQFSKDILGKSILSISAFWQNKIFTGRAVPPVIKASDNEVIAYVKINPGAIGYISSSISIGGVKVVNVE